MRNTRLLKLLIRISESIQNNDTLKKRELYNRVLAKLRYYNRNSYKILDEMIADNIIEFVGKNMDVPTDYNILKTRKRKIVLSRQISMTLIKNNTELSLENVGKLFNGKDHATVLHALKTINNLNDTNKEFNTQFYYIVEIMRLKYKPYAQKRY